MDRKVAKEVRYLTDDKGIDVGWVELGKQECRLLDALKTSDVTEDSVSEICRRAHISRQSYYQFFKRSEFRKAVKELVGNMLYESLVPVTKKLREKAMEFKDHHPARMLYEMTGLMNPNATQATQINLSLGFARPKFEDQKETKEI